MFAEDKEDEECVGYLPIEVDKNDLEKTYNYYIQSLINSYEYIRKKYKHYIDLLSPPQLSLLFKTHESKLPLEAPRLVISHEL